MGRINLTVDILKFDSGRYTKALGASIGLQMKRAALAFVRAALLRMDGHVDTGMAAGSYLHLGRYLRNLGVGEAGVEPFIASQRKRGPGKYYHPPGRAGKPIPKDQNTAGDFGLVPKPVTMFKFDGRHRQVFTFYSNVFHYKLHEFGFEGPAWESFEAGRAAYMAEMKNLKTLIPPVKEFMVKSTVSIGRGGGFTVIRTPEKPLKPTRRQEKIT